jgi:predicted transcriptional regulator
LQRALYKLMVSKYGQRIIMMEKAQLLRSRYQSKNRTKNSPDRHRYTIALSKRLRPTISPSESQ